MSARQSAPVRGLLSPDTGAATLTGQQCTVGGSTHRRNDALHETLCSDLPQVQHAPRVLVQHYATSACTRHADVEWGRAPLLQARRMRQYRGALYGHVCIEHDTAQHRQADMAASCCVRSLLGQPQAPSAHTGRPLQSVICPPQPRTAQLLCNLPPGKNSCAQGILWSSL